jgi:cell division septal protein FtsQ
MDDIKKPKMNEEPPLTEPTLNHIAAQPTRLEDEIVIDESKGGDVPAKKPKRQNPFKRLSKKQLIVLGIVFLLLVGLGIYFFVIKKMRLLQTKQ